MEITRAEVTPVELSLQHPVHMAGLQPITQVTTIFVRIETREGQNAWGCGVAYPELTGEKPDEALRTCKEGAERALDLHPTNIEYSLTELAPIIKDSPAASCAFDLAFYDLLGLAAGMPLYRLLGGFRNRIQTSITVSLAPVQESVEQARRRAGLGFRILKIKGGIDPDLDVQRVQSIHRALPNHTLRLDADGGYTVREALEVGRALEGIIEMFEQPTPAGDLEALRQVTKNCPVPVLADQSVAGPASALQIGAQKMASGLSIKLATCGGLHCARQMDAIARAAQVQMMVSCVIEPALLIAAGLSLALSSPNVRYGDLDGHFDLMDDPTQPGFLQEDGWLVASDRPGLGCIVNL